MSSIFGVQNSSSTDSVQSLASLLQTTQSSGGTTASASSGSVSGAASTDFSQQSQILSKLQSLASSDPAQFKQVTAQFAASLNQLAQQVGGTAGQNLTKLADKFTQASQTGSAAGLQPKVHHHHGGAHKAYSQDSSSSLASLLGGSTSSSSSTSGASVQQQVTSLFQQLGGATATA